MRETKRTPRHVCFAFGICCGEPFDVKSVALTGLFVRSQQCFYTMYFMRAMLLPLVLALLLSYLLAPVVRLFGRIRVKPALGAALVLLSLVGLVVYGVSRLAEPPPRGLVGESALQHAPIEAEAPASSRGRWKRSRRRPVKSTN